MIPDLRRAFESWLERFGHSGVHASDISRPRYREEPGLLLRSLASAPLRASPAPGRLSLKATLLRPVAWQAERTLRARESLRSAALVGFERLRRVLLDRAHLLVEDGVLPSVDSLFDLDVDEARRLEEDFRPDAEFWSARRKEIDGVRALDVPDVVHRFDDVESLPLPAAGRGRAEGAPRYRPDPGGGGGAGVGARRAGRRAPAGIRPVRDNPGRPGGGPRLVPHLRPRGRGGGRESGETSPMGRSSCARWESPRSPTSPA